MPLDQPQRSLLESLRHLKALYHRQRNPGAFTEGMQQVLTRLELLEKDSLPV